MAYRYENLTQEQLAYLRASMQSIGLRDRVFTGPQVFNELPLAKRQALFSDLSRPQTQQNINTWIRENNWYATRPAPNPPVTIPNAQIAGTLDNTEAALAGSADPGGGVVRGKIRRPTDPVQPNSPVPPAVAKGQIQGPSNETNETATDVAGPPTVKSESTNTSDNAGTNTLNPFSNPAQLPVVEIVATRESSDVQSRPQTVNINPLHDYSSYTYGLSLHTISTGDFNDIINNPELGYAPVTNVEGILRGTVLIASAGRKNDASFPRNVYWDNGNFYFENLRMSTLINTTERNRNSNLVELTFTIVEPLGFTFVDRIMAAVTQVGGSNYLRHPYILQIDFFGSKDTAEPGLSTDTATNSATPGPIPGLSKIIPIQLVRIRSRVTTKGVEYTIEAVPFNHQALSEVYVLSPANFTVQAKTITDVFGAGKNNSIKLTDPAYDQARGDQRELASAQSRVEINQRATRTQDANASQWRSGFDLPGGGDRTNNSANQLPQPTYPVSGFCDGYNSFYNNLVNNAGLKLTGQQITQISVEFHESFKNYNLIPTAGPQTVTQTATGANNLSTDKSATQQAGGAAKNVVSFDGTSLNIPANTKIDQLIEWTVRNSEWYREKNEAFNRNDVNSSSAATNQYNTPYNWIKIVPKVLIKGYDEQTSRYRVEVIYYVKPYIKTTSFPYAPLGRQPGYVKEYNWIYTGGESPITGQPRSNKDVIDLQVDFSMLYYNAVTVFPTKENMQETAKTVNDQILGYIDNGVACLKVPEYSQDQDVPIKWSQVSPVSTKFITQNLRRQARTGYGASNPVNAADTANSFMTNARSDMIQVNLKILGDPHFIKQDDIFFGQNSKVSMDSYTPNGSLYMDNGELYVFINFESPIDYDESTGLAIPEKNIFTSFTGVYKIVRIENTFAKGKFTQELLLSKLLIDDRDRDIQTRFSRRAEAYLDQNLGQIAGFNPVRFSGPQANLQGLNINLTTPTQLLNQAQAAAGSVVSRLASTATSAATSAIQGAANKFITDKLKEVFAEKPSGWTSGQDLPGGADPGGAGAINERVVSESAQASGDASIGVNPQEIDGFAAEGLGDFGELAPTLEVDAFGDIGGDIVGIGEGFGDLTEFTDIGADALGDIVEVVDLGDLEGFADLAGDFIGGLF